MEEAEALTGKRLSIWKQHKTALATLEAACVLRRPSILNGCQHNAHTYYTLE
jgi:dTDP-4-amino-4,6-dideoxygalactose transaminase